MVDGGGCGGVLKAESGTSANTDRSAGFDSERAFRRTAKSCQSIGDLPAIQRNYRVVKADLSIVLAAIVTATDDIVRWEYMVPRGRIGDRLDGGFHVRN